MEEAQVLVSPLHIDTKEENVTMSETVTITRAEYDYLTAEYKRLDAFVLDVLTIYDEQNAYVKELEARIATLLQGQSRCCP